MEEKFEDFILSLVELGYYETDNVEITVPSGMFKYMVYSRFGENTDTTKESECFLESNFSFDNVISGESSVKVINILKLEEFPIYSSMGKFIIKRESYE